MKVEIELQDIETLRNQNNELHRKINELEKKISSLDELSFKRDVARTANAVFEAYIAAAFKALGVEPAEPERPFVKSHTFIKQGLYGWDYDPEQAKIAENLEVDLVAILSEGIVKGYLEMGLKIKE